MIARPFVSLIEASLKQHNIKNVAELASLCKGKLSAPALYAILGGSTPNEKALSVLVEVLGISKTLAVSARDEQRNIDKSIGRGPGSKKKEPAAFKVSLSEKALINKLRGVDEKRRKLIVKVVNTLASEDS